MVIAAADEANETYPMQNTFAEEFKSLCNPIDSDRKNEPRVSVFGTVRRLREQRCYMVKKQSQYVFLYTYMDLWIKHDLANGADPDRILFDFSLQNDKVASVTV